MTSFLSRDEMHERVDAIYDAVEDAEGEEALAVIGGLTGSLNVNAPSEKTDFHRLRGTIGYAEFAFDGAWPLGEAARNGVQNDMLGTVVVPRSSVQDEVARAALDGDEDAIAAVQGEQ